MGGSGDSVYEIGAQLTQACDTVSHWMIGNKLKLNPEKTPLLTVGTWRGLRGWESNLQGSVDSIQLQESEVYLAVS